MSPPDESLETLLRRWGSESPPPPDPVAPEVWRRLGLAAQLATPRRPTWRERCEAIGARPSFAAAFVTACVLAGLFLAEVRASHLRADRDARLHQSYLRLVDPAGSASSASPHAGSSPTP